MKNKPGVSAQRPRRIWLNSVGAQNGEGKEEELRKSLPYCDIETGTKNRVVERDPISGLGMLGKEFDPLTEERETHRATKSRENRNPINGEGNLGQEVNIFSKPDGYKSSRPSRNPLESAEPEADRMQPKGKPGKVTIRQAQRDPISGRGEFGREWDPIYKYSGRPRPWHPQAKDGKRGGRCNPLTGESAKSFDVHQELKRTPRKDVKRANPVTGENCCSFTVSDKLNEQYIKTGSKTARNCNPLTGQNCKSFEFTVESKPLTARKSAGGNPLTGDKCETFAYSSEFKQRETKRNVQQNPVTGANVRSFILHSTEKDERPQRLRPRSASVEKNPLTGRNCCSFTVSREERPRTAPATGGRANPVTGENCRHFVLATDERKSAHHSEVRQTGNPLTGENLATFHINREMRVNRQQSVQQKQPNGVIPGRQNPITGESPF